VIEEFEDTKGLIRIRSVVLQLVKFGMFVSLHYRKHSINFCVAKI